VASLAEVAHSVRGDPGTDLILVQLGQTKRRPGVRRNRLAVPWSELRGQPFRSDLRPDADWPSLL
jgi:hypothetical protein